MGSSGMTSILAEAAAGEASEARLEQAGNKRLQQRQPHPSSDASLSAAGSNAARCRGAPPRRRFFPPKPTDSDAASRPLYCFLVSLSGGTPSGCCFCRRRRRSCW
jgi:hypothetical protein